MLFSSSMSVVQYYILDRFPVPYGKHKQQKTKLEFEIQSCNLWNLVVIWLKFETYFFLFISFSAAAYFSLVATIAALAGQHVLRKIIAILGRASIIIFLLALTIFISAISLGKFCDFYWAFFFNIFHFFQWCLFILLLMYHRWGGNREHDWEDGEPWVYGVWKPLRSFLGVFCLYD